MYASLYEAFLKTRQDYTFYVPPQREDSSVAGDPL